MNSEITTDERREAVIEWQLDNYEEQLNEMGYEELFGEQLLEQMVENHIEGLLEQRREELEEQSDGELLGDEEFEGEELDDEGGGAE